MIPASRIDPIALRFINLYPLPTSAGLGSNYTTNVTRAQTSDTFDLRVDHRVTKNGTLYARYSDNAVNTHVPGVFGLVNGVDSGGSAAGFAAGRPDSVPPLVSVGGSELKLWLMSPGCP